MTIQLAIVLIKRPPKMEFHSELWLWLHALVLRISIANRNFIEHGWRLIASWWQRPVYIAQTFHFKGVAKTIATSHATVYQRKHNTQKKVATIAFILWQGWKLDMCFSGPQNLVRTHTHTHINAEFTYLRLECNSVLQSWWLIRKVGFNLRRNLSNFAIQRRLHRCGEENDCSP